MKIQIYDGSARQHSGEPSSGLGPNGSGKDRRRNPDPVGLDCDIARLVERSTQELRGAWRTLHHTGPPLGLSRDLIIRGLADKLQQRAHAGASRTLQRRLRILAAEFERGARSFKFRHCAEDRCVLGAAMAGAHPYRSRARGRVRIRGPALSVVDSDRQADNRSTLVGPAFLWPPQANASLLVAEAGP
jgi:hypothetical protein